MSEHGVIPGTKLIKLTGKVNIPDDPAFPFKLEAHFRPPPDDLAFMLMHDGNEKLVVGGMTREALDKFIEVYKLYTHPRFRRLTITGPAGMVKSCWAPSGDR